jgi:hypothetical protein
VVENSEKPVEQEDAELVLDARSRERYLSQLLLAIHKRAG